MFYCQGALSPKVGQETVLARRQGPWLVSCNALPGGSTNWRLWAWVWETSPVSGEISYWGLFEMLIEIHLRLGWKISGTQFHFTELPTVALSRTNFSTCAVTFFDDYRSTVVKLSTLEQPRLQHVLWTDCVDIWQGLVTTDVIINMLQQVMSPDYIIVDNLL